MGCSGAAVYAFLQVPSCALLVVWLPWCLFMLILVVSFLYYCNPCLASHGAGRHTHAPRGDLLQWRSIEGKKCQRSEGYQVLVIFILSFPSTANPKPPEVVLPVLQYPLTLDCVLISQWCNLLRSSTSSTSRRRLTFSERRFPTAAHPIH